MKPSETRTKDLRPLWSTRASSDALQRLEGDPVARGGGVVDLRRAAGDEGVLHRPDVLVRAGPAVHGLHARALEAALDPVHDLGVTEDVDAHGLVVGHAVAARFGDVAPVEALHQLDERGAARLHARAPPGAARRWRPG